MRRYTDLDPVVRMRPYSGGQQERGLYSSKTVSARRASTTLSKLLDPRQASTSGIWVSTSCRYRSARQPVTTSRFSFPSSLYAAASRIASMDSLFAGSMKVQVCTITPSHSARSLQISNPLSSSCLSIISASMRFFAHPSAIMPIFKGIRPFRRVHNGKAPMRWRRNRSRAAPALRRSSALRQDRLMRFPW